MAAKVISAGDFSQLASSLVFLKSTLGDHASLEHAELSRYWGHFARGPGRRSSLSRYLFALSVTPSGTHGIERCFSMAKSLTRSVPASWCQT